MRLIVFVVIGFLLFSSTAMAATIFGTVYDLSLEQAKNVRVSISTVPEQQIIAVNGRYSFNVQAGTYMLTAEQRRNDQILAQAVEEVVVVQDGVFVHDLILEPYIEEEEALTNFSGLEIESLTLDDTKKTDYLFIVVLVALIIVAAFLIYRVNKVMKSFHAVKKEVAVQKDEPKAETKPQQLPEDLHQVIQFVQEQQGRTTQKEIRTKFPQSEAKVSLMIADLEKRGLVKKVKKGRGNVIILNETNSGKSFE